jgi:hypothetical protein
MTRLHVLLVLLLGVAGLAGILLYARDDPGDDDSVGATVDLIEYAVLPIEWSGNDAVTFQTFNGSYGGATVRLDGTVVSTRPDGRALVEPRGTTLESDAEFGSWRPWAGGHYLVRNNEKCGPPLLPSPDGRFIACVHAIHPMNEPSASHGAVIRVR